METHDNYLNLITGLKSNNITTNIASLNTSSELIEIYLNEAKNATNISVISQNNIDRSIEIIRHTKGEQINPDELINFYIKFGDIFKSILPELKEKKVENLNKIAIQYLNIAKQTKDTRIKNIAVAIAEAEINSRK